MCEPLILDGGKVAEELYSKLPNMNGKELAIITFGEDPASKTYVRSKIKSCERVGIKGVNYRFSEADILAKAIQLIIELNKNTNVVGIIVQRPYPEKFAGIESYIDVHKDVDGLKESNLGKTMLGKKPFFYPATPKGIITLLDYYKIPIEGKNVVIINRSEIVGLPLSAMLRTRNATVTVCHSKTEDLRFYTKSADIIVSAVGKPKFINSSYFSMFNRPVIIDVGMNRDENGKLCGDVDFNDVLPSVSAITPVPGGVGPMTRYALIKNCADNNM